MKVQDKKSTNADSLRRKAEAKLKTKNEWGSPAPTETDMIRLIHELQVYRIELELQNNELLQSQKQEALAREKYTNFFDFAPVAYFVLTTNGVIAELNLAGANMVGKERRNLVRSKFAFFISPDTRNDFTDFLSAILNSKNPRSCEVTFNVSDDTPLYAQLSGTLTDEGKHCLITATDITERKKMEKSLQHALTKYRALFTIFPMGITVSDRAGRITESNRMAEKLLGLSEEETAKRRIDGEVWQIVRTDGTAMPSCEFPSVIAMAENCVVDNVKMGIVKNPSETTWINVSAAPVPVEDAGVVIVYSDISESKLIEDTQNFLMGCGLPGTGEDFFESLARYMAETLNMGYVCIDRLEGDGLMAQTVAVYNEGRFENNVLYALKDTPCGEVVDKNVCCFRHGVRLRFPNDAALRDLNAESYLGRTLLDSKGKPIGLIAIIGHQPLIEAGKGETLLKLVAPRTSAELERREAENALKNTLAQLYAAKEKAEESDHLKTAFLANMSHEIRTPMNGILGFSELLKEPGLNCVKQQEYIRIIEKSGTRMLNIINNIVDISKIEAGMIKVDLKESDINEQIEYIYTFFKPEAETKGMQFFLKKGLPPGEATILTDREKLYAILTNLVKNAIKYTDKGSIEIGYDRKMPDGQPSLVFYVKDTGIGIPENCRKAIFERFVQADISDRQARQGAGLGLTITKSYIEMLGGKIWVESEQGIGSTFYFTLPYPVKAVEKQNFDKYLPLNNDPVETSDLKILIVEDDEPSALLLKIELQNFGSEFLIAGSGTQAVEICGKNPDIDLIFMDIRLPEMDGCEATRLIRQFNESVIIIAQTAYGLSGDRESVIEAGCSDYIVKPVNRTLLFEIMQKYFEK